MNESGSRASTAIIIALLVANLAVSAYGVFRPADQGRASPVAGRSSADVEGSEAEALAARVVPIFNSGDTRAMYEMFDPLAKIQLTEADVAAKFGNLGEIIGKVDEYVFSHATVEGVQEGRTFYKLVYRVRLSGGPFSAGDLSLTAFRKDGKLALYGIYINGTNRAAVD